MAFLETQVLQDAFGSFLTVLILLEFNHSIAVSLRTRSGAIQACVVVPIAIMVIARKLILLDFKSAQVEMLAGLGGLGSFSVRRLGCWPTPSPAKRPFRPSKGRQAGVSCSPSKDLPARFAPSCRAARSCG